MKLVKKEDNKSILWSEMEDGDIGVIRQWKPESHIGEIVQRYDNFLINLGRIKDESWGKKFSSQVGLLDSEYRVEILPPGTLLEI